MTTRTGALSSPGATLDRPSAQPDMVGARPSGVISGAAQETRSAFFKTSALAGFGWRRDFSSKDATRLFRFGAQCDAPACQHDDGQRCSLGHRVKDGLEAVVDALPPCLIRPPCRWSAEQGQEVGLRCPQVVTMIPEADAPLNAIALPARNS